MGPTIQDSYEKADLQNTDPGTLSSWQADIDRRFTVPSGFWNYMADYVRRTMLPRINERRSNRGQPENAFG